jgi:hypothetical protein
LSTSWWISPWCTSAADSSSGSGLLARQACSWDVATSSQQLRGLSIRRSPPLFCRSFLAFFHIGSLLCVKFSLFRVGTFCCSPRLFLFAFCSSPFSLPPNSHYLCWWPHSTRLPSLDRDWTTSTTSIACSRWISSTARGPVEV